MTPGAAHAHCGMNVLFGSHDLIVTPVAEVGLFRGEPSRQGVRFLVRHGPGIDRRVARGTPHLQGLMLEFPVCQLLVAREAIFLTGCGKRAQKNGNK